MTTFEITIIALLAAIVVLLIVLLGIAIEGFHGVWQNQNAGVEQLCNIEVNTHHASNTLKGHIAPDVEIISNNFLHLLDEGKGLPALVNIVDKMHRNLCVEIADKMVNKMYPVNEGESLDAPFEPDYKLKKDIECKLNGFAAAVLDAECCTKEMVDFWLERICDAAYKYIKQLKIDWDKLSKEQQDEFLKRLIMPNYDSPFQPIYTPCYAPDGICTNPQRDCINCPKIGTGGTWSTNTSIKAKDAPLQERFNDNKED